MMNSENPQEKSQNTSQIYQFIKWYLFLGGGLLVIFGIIHILGIMMGDATYLQIGDAIFNSSLGIIYFICGYLHLKRNPVVIWIYIASVLYSLVYSFAVGRGFNIYITIFGAYVTYQFFAIKKKNEYSK